MNLENLVKYKVLLTTSGIGSRLGEITTYTNKGLVKVGKKPALSYIVESYPTNIEFVVTLGHHASHVKQFLELVYPNRKFTFVEVDNYDGPGSSLGYSQLCAKEHLQCPFIYNACDTIVFDKIPEPTTNWVGGFKQKGSSQYAGYSTTTGNVKEFYTKGYIDFEYAYIGLSGVYDYENYWKTFDNIHSKFPEKKSLSDLHCLKQQLQNGVGIKHVEFKSWYDIGNVESLNRARKDIPDSFYILEKLNESIYLFDDKVVKFFADKNIVKQRVERAATLNGLVPKIISKTDNFYSYEYAKGDLYSKVANPVNIKQLLDWTNKHLWQTKQSVSNDKFDNACKTFYYEKTYKRLDSFYSKTHTIDGIDTINGAVVPPVSELLSSIGSEYLCKTEQTGFHGDFILDNIILGDAGFVLLDWRQNFGGLIESGDMYYDLAKLNHNLVVNHEIVSNNLFSVSKIKDKISVDIHRRQSLIDCQQTYHNWLVENGFDLKRVKILTAIVWLNMSTLHHHPLDEFLYYFGKYSLFTALGENYE
mgnify:CR=1 FL=1